MNFISVSAEGTAWVVNKVGPVVEAVAVMEGNDGVMGVGDTFTTANPVLFFHRSSEIELRDYLLISALVHQKVDPRSEREAILPNKHPKHNN